MINRDLIRATCRGAIVSVLLGSGGLKVEATPANKAALERHYDKFLPKNLDRCTTCHLPSDNKAPESLDEFPHNPFGRRLRVLGQELAKKGAPRDIATRLKLVAREDSDGDGVDNETELLLGHNPGDPADMPGRKELSGARQRRGEFENFLVSYRWKPFEPVIRPAVPKTRNSRLAQNPIDAFIEASREARKLEARPEAARETLLRRVYLDLIGLSPTPAEQQAFAEDKSASAYEKVVDRLLGDPRYGERWGRHWMDVWRYSDWAGWSGGNQIRDSQPHIWRWRDWIVESLNADKGYDRMVLEMLAADELAPEDSDALRATGYLVRNYKMLSREQWLEDTIKHTSQAFLGLTVGCAKCHDHMFDPISQSEYYQMRAIFEPHQVRTVRVPGEVDPAKNGLVRVFDTATNPPTFLYLRGDERRPETNHVMSPGIPQILGGNFHPEPVQRSTLAAFPDKREFVIQDSLAAGEKALALAKEALEKLWMNSATNSDKLREAEFNLEIAVERQTALRGVIRAEKLEDENRKESEEWKSAASAATEAQRKQAMAEAKLKLHTAQTAQKELQRKVDEAEKAAAAAVETEPAATGKKPDVTKATKDLDAGKKKLAEAEAALAAAEKQTAPSTHYKARTTDTYPTESTGRRLAFARWLTDTRNPLTARVAANQIWLRHFGQGIVATPSDFGRNGRAPSHPQLLDWLAAELMSHDWSMKHLHRLIVTSNTYRLSSTGNEADAQIDPDNIYLWRTPSRRMEAELVRDNLLYVSGDLDAAMGGAEIDQNLGLTSKRRSLYLRLAAEKEVEFLKIFDGPAVTECYLRHPTVVPQQALALANSEIALGAARALAGKLSLDAGDDDAKFVRDGIARILSRRATEGEMKLGQDFLMERARQTSRERARQNLMLVLFNHNDFVTIR